MRPGRYPRTIVLAVGTVFLSLWLGTQQQVLAQGYDGGGTGTSALSFDPQSLMVSQDGWASAKVTVRLTSGKAGGTNLTAIPSGGVAVTFNPASGSPTFTSTMTVRADSPVRQGTYTVKVQATGDDPSPTVQYSVTVLKAAGY